MRSIFLSPGREPQKEHCGEDVVEGAADGPDADVPLPAEPVNNNIQQVRSADVNKELKVNKPEPVVRVDVEVDDEDADRVEERHQDRREHQAQPTTAAVLNE